ncbi:MAG: family 43 glycosylhydrolase [Candidatus Krumholzibacteriota bacterium]|nr:family 43 glycosylhydrolase [Candidatus Krumholzibacteriota bacterium]
MNTELEKLLIRDLIVPTARWHHALPRAVLLSLLLTVPVFSPVRSEVAPVALETTGFDFEGPVLHRPGMLIKDHSLIKQEGLFHIFFITGEGREFGHATSPDLRRWTILETPLSAGPDEWDDNYVWAPHVVPMEDLPPYYLMYYTGVNDHIAQRTCLAVSSGDLSRWTKAPPFLMEAFHCDTSWAQWDENSWSNFRDPCFFRDNGTEYLIQTALTKDGYAAIALCANNGFFDWNDAGPLYVHHNWHVLESSFLIKREDRYHLFFTEETVGGISHMSSPTLTGGYNILDRIIIDSGHACELLDAGGDLHVFSRHTSYLLPSGGSLSSVRFDTLGWDAGFPVVEIPWDLEGDWTIVEGTAFNRQPVFGNNPLYRGDDTTTVGFEGNWWIGTYESFNGPLRGLSPGAIQGDAPRGIIQSRTFTVRGRSMKLLVGGGHYPHTCFVALYEDGGQRLIYKETGRNREEMDERTWNLEPWRGKEVYIRIVDNSSEPFGHINVDSIRELTDPARPLPDDIDPPDPSGRKDLKPRYLSSGEDGGPGPSAFPTLLSAFPNPFNPQTTISFQGDPRGRYTLAIYAVSGRRIVSFPAETDRSGRGAVLWSGRDQGGAPVSSGIYAAVLLSGDRIIGVNKLILIR